jgi:DNA processing protein
MPGRVTDSFSSGCHELIRQNKAMIFSNAAHIADAMNWNRIETHSKSEKQLALFRELSDEEKVIITLMKKSNQSSIDDLAINSAMPVSKVSSLLLKLEFDGLLRSLPGKMYELN